MIQEEQLSQLGVPSPTQMLPLQLLGRTLLHQIGGKCPF